MDQQPPRRQQITNAIRERIVSGDLAPGALLPSEPEVTRTYDVTRHTAQAALRDLEHEGLAVVLPGRGRVVRDTRRVQLPADRYLRAGGPAGGPWETACAALGLTGHTEVVEVAEHPADEIVAAALGLEAGHRAIRRLNRMYLGDDVVQLQDTWLDPARFGNTALAQAPIIAGGIYKGLADLGYPPASAAETVTARMPTRPEVEDLRLEPGTPVIDVRRTTYTADDTALAHVHLVLDGGRVSLAYHQLID
jgi:GntR family transcriptional regulator